MRAISHPVQTAVDELLLILFPVGFGRQSRFLLERGCKVVGVVVTDFIRDVDDGHLGIRQKVHGAFDA